MTQLYRPLHIIAKCPDCSLFNTSACRYPASNGPENYCVLFQEKGPSNEEGAT